MKNNKMIKMDFYKSNRSLSLLPLLLILMLIVISLLTPPLAALEIDENLTIKTEQLQKLEPRRVQRVIDGDTVELADGDHLRFIGVDTPELQHHQQQVEYFGKEARDFTKNALHHQKIFLEYDVETRDQYGRLLAYVFLKDGTFFNARLLHEGYARLLTIPPNVKYSDLFVKVVQEARRQKRGLWKKKLSKDAKKDLDKDLPVIRWQQAEQYLGEKVYVEGQVIDTYDSGKAVFLNFDEEYWHTFSAVIFSSDKYKFEQEPDSHFLDKKVRIQGKIQEYEGAPEIIIKEPSQIEIISP